MPRQLKGIIESVQHDKARKIQRGKLTHYKKGGQIPYEAAYGLRLAPGDEVLYEAPATPRMTGTRTMPRSWGSSTVRVVKVLGRSSTPQ